MARIKLAYPKIPDSRNCPLERCIAFEKYDGTNIHWVWDIELGWYSFGTRRNRFDLDELGIAQFNAAHPGLEAAPQIFMSNYAQQLERLWRENSEYNCAEITVFTEFLGANSFAGMHKPEDPKQLILFDVQTDKSMVAPEKFIQDFQSFNIARVVYRGRLTGKFIEDVRDGKYGVTEGVVCKGVSKDNAAWMVKIKTYAYMQRLKQAFQEDWEKYWE